MYLMQHLILNSIITNTEKFYEGDLIHYFKVIWNSAGTYNPYHGFRHVNHVMFSCHDAIIFYKDILSKRDARNILIAALLHDLDHSGTKMKDSIQVDRAIEGFRKNIVEEDKPFQKQIEEIIRATEYPYESKTENLPPSQQIIRDADMTQMFTQAWIQQVIFGLGKEWSLNPTEMLEKQEEMLKNHEWHTDWAKEKYGQKAIDEKLKEVEELMKIVEDAK